MSRETKLTFALLALTFWGLIGSTSGSVSTEPGAEPSQTKEENSMAQSITANLIVRDMEETITFYHDLLGFELIASQPQDKPYVWAMMQNGQAQLMFQNRESIAEELDRFADVPLGGSFTLFMVVDDVESFRARLVGKATVLKGLNKTFYGMLEVTIEDPNGYVITLAQQIDE